MSLSHPLPMTRSEVALAQTAYRIAKAGLQPYSNAKSRHDFLQAQLFAILILRQFRKTDYRTIVQALADSQELRDALELQKVPHYTTVQKAAQRLIKKGLSTDSCRPFSAPAESIA